MIDQAVGWSWIVSVGLYQFLSIIGFLCDQIGLHDISPVLKNDLKKTKQIFFDKYNVIFHVFNMSDQLENRGMYISTLTLLGNWKSRA